MTGQARVAHPRPAHRASRNDHRRRRHRDHRPQTDLCLQGRRRRHEPRPKPHGIHREHHQLPIRQTQPADRSQDQKHDEPVSLPVQTRRCGQPHQPRSQHHCGNGRHENLLRGELREFARMPTDSRTAMQQKQLHRTLRLRLRRRRKRDGDHTVERHQRHDVRLQRSKRDLEPHAVR